MIRNARVGVECDLEIINRFRERGRNFSRAVVRIQQRDLSRRGRVRRLRPHAVDVRWGHIRGPEHDGLRTDGLRVQRKHDRGRKHRDDSNSRNSRGRPVP